MRSIETVTAQGETRTPDLGGTNMTQEVGEMMRSTLRALVGAS